MYSLGQDLSVDTNIFDLMALTLTFTYFQWCRNSSDLSDNRTFLMNVRQKMLECRTKRPTEIIKNIHFMDEKKQNISDYIGQQLDFNSSHCFL